jgi:hypothetical protein
MLVAAHVLNVEEGETPRKGRSPTSISSAASERSAFDSAHVERPKG